jgi:hypothetical protein
LHVEQFLLIDGWFYKKTFLQRINLLTFFLKIGRGFLISPFGQSTVCARAFNFLVSDAKASDALRKSFMPGIS